MDYIISTGLGAMMNDSDDITKVAQVTADDLASPVVGVVNTGDDASYQVILKALSEGPMTVSNVAGLFGMGGMYARADGKEITAEEAEKAKEKKARDAIKNARKVKRRPAPDTAVEKMAAGDISQVDDDKQMVFGWAYVTHDTTGEINVDKSGDFIDAIEEIEKSAYDFVLNHSATDNDHNNVKSGTVIESVVFTPEKIEKMGLAPDAVPLGWWIGTYIEDKEVWSDVKKGKYRAFSIHGKGTRSKVDPS